MIVGRRICDVSLNPNNCTTARDIYICSSNNTCDLCIKPQSCGSFSLFRSLFSCGELTIWYSKAEWVGPSLSQRVNDFTIPLSPSRNNKSKNNDCDDLNTHSAITHRYCCAFADADDDASAHLLIRAPRLGNGKLHSRCWKGLLPRCLTASWACTLGTSTQNN